METSSKTITALNKIKEMPVKSADEMSHVMEIIDSIGDHLEPFEIAMLQLQVIISHYNLNKVEGAEEMTMVDVLLRRLAPQTIVL